MSRARKFASSSSSPSTSPPRLAPRRRGLPWGKLFLLALISLVALAWFAPTIVMKTNLRDRLVKTALQDFPGTVAIGSASAGWLSSIELNGASVFDGKGQEILTVNSIRTEKNLFSLLLDKREIGTIRVDQPKLNLELRSDGSNVEDLLLPWLAAQKSQAAVGVAVEIVEGTVHATQVDGGAKWQLEHLNANMKLPPDRNSLTARIKTGIASEGSTAGSLVADLQWQHGATSAAEAKAALLPWQGAVTIQAAGLPLEIATLGLRRAGLDIQLAGLLTTNAAITISDRFHVAKIEQFSAQNLFVASSSLLGADQIQLTAVSGAGEISRSSDEWQLRNVNLKSEVGELNAAGAGPVSGTGSVSSELTRAFRNGNWEVRGNLDLAKLATMMPNTLRLREGTHISSGQITVDLNSESKPEGNVWNAALQANELAAIHAGNSFEWKRPIIVKASVKESAIGIAVEQFTCDSTFLQLTGKGTLAQGQIAVTGDLSQFVNEVGRFVDLGTLKAGGKFNGQVAWQNSGEQSLSLSGKASAQDVELTYAADRPWQEQRLDIQFAAAGRIADGHITQVNTGSLGVTAAGDILDLELLEPVVAPSAETLWPCHVHVRGDLGQWLARMQMLFTLEDWQLDGEISDIDGNVRASKQRLELADTKGTIKNFTLLGPGLTIREPTLQIDTTATYDVAGNEFTTPSTTISGATVALRAENARLLYRAGQVALDGDIQYRTNLERLVAWVRDPQQPQTQRIQGEATGTLRLEYSQGATKADATANIDNFAYSIPVKTSGLTIAPLNQAAGWRELWKEPRLELAVQGSLDAAGQLATIDKLQVAGDSLSLGAAGAVRDPLARCEIDVSGQYAYDLERLAQRVRGMIGPQVQMVGTGQRPFAFRGPLFASTKPQPAVRGVSNKATPTSSYASLEEMLAEVSIGWQQLIVQGVEIGEGEIATKLQQGQLTISPINLPVSEGKIAIAPRIDVTRTPYEATLEPGTVVDHVRITPQMCRSWLKYLAPLAADATAADGHFSVSLDDSRFPVTDPTGGNVQGTLVIHSAQIGPGPLSQEIIAVAQQIRAIIDKQPLGAVQPSSSEQWLDVPEQQMNFQLADHKVYHRDMQFLMKDVAVTTSGWVGLDQQIALVAVVPIRDEWVSKDRYFAALKGQTLRLPINGTLTRPQLDRTALRQLTRQTVINAGSNLLQDELNRGLEKGLNKLFQPKPAPQQPQ